MIQTFENEIAKKYGIEEAILIDFFYKEMKDTNSVGIKISTSKLVHFLPYMTYYQAQMALYHLRELGVLIAKPDALVLNYELSDDLMSELDMYYKED